MTRPASVRGGSQCESYITLICGTVQSLLRKGQDGWEWGGVGIIDCHLEIRLSCIPNDDNSLLNLQLRGRDTRQKYCHSQGERLSSHMPTLRRLCQQLSKHVSSLLLAVHLHAGHCPQSVQTSAILPSGSNWQPHALLKALPTGRVISFKLSILQSMCYSCNSMIICLRKGWQIVQNYLFFPSLTSYKKAHGALDAG